jgi:hypothetical protein
MTESNDQGELFPEPNNPKKLLTREELQEIAQQIGANADRQRREAEQAGRPLDPERRSAAYDDLGGRLPEPAPEDTE